VPTIVVGIAAEGVSELGKERRRGGGEIASDVSGRGDVGLRGFWGGGAKTCQVGDDTTGSHPP